MIAIIDNYDSFTYNIFQEVSELTGEEVRVFRNDKISLEDLQKLKPAKLIISPGPGTPADAGISIAAIREFSGKVPILGVCLGHQAIAEAFGGRIVQASNIVHGKVEKMKLDGRGLFRNLDAEAEFTRYHSLAAERDSLPDCLEITAESTDGEIMGIRHKELIVEGVQFHPESIGCIDSGRIILKNFLRYKREPLDKKGMLSRLQERGHLSFDEAADFMDELTEGALSPVFMAAILTALNCKGITPEEIAGCASVLKKKKQVIKTSVSTLDTCGTGGDGKHTFNISSMSALIASACGAKVAKHGNRAVSSKSGSADFYANLGINYNLTPEQSEKLLEEEGFVFMFAPIFHGAMRHAGPVRAELGVKTIMNLLGPLVNPAESEYQIIGVYDKELCPVMARAAKMTGVKRVMVVHSEDGLDELSPAAKARVFMIDENEEESDIEFNPEDAGFSGFRTSELTGGSGAENAATALRIIEGSGPEAIKAACVLNAGAALAAAGIVDSIIEGCNAAAEAIESGAVKDKLDAVVRKSRMLGKQNAG
ncbi:MAG: bifunctional anthranilate synthase component II/anthranilate phosphoribosyltransferase [Spirochaetales bacterium]|uniref:Anthranilate phosphoribosyltransferase n=1 Tax=Candidatus Thalassospirochaeta sargassi TaxID=3119039 RepID=A0AAJ1MKG5_9SPIO|nr:bifunctional anthranilate synthase component II/anthranilate phosphoribosyltransferase [Spirochaetales bacterium]